MTTETENPSSEDAESKASATAPTDQPTVVSPLLSLIDIGLRKAAWSNDASRESGMRDFIVAQSGTAGTLNELAFAQKLSRAVITKVLPKALGNAASAVCWWYKRKLLKAARRVETEGTAIAASYALKVAYSVYAVFAVDGETQASTHAEKSEAADAVHVAHAIRSACYASMHALAAAKLADGAPEFTPEMAYRVTYAVMHAVSAAGDPSAYIHSSHTAAYNEAMEYPAWAGFEAAFAAAYAGKHPPAAADKLLREFTQEILHILLEMKN